LLTKSAIRNKIVYYHSVLCIVQHQKWAGMTYSNTAGHIPRIVLASCAHTCPCEHARTPICVHAYTHACILVYVDRVYQKLCCAYLSVQYAHSHPRPNTYHPTNSHYKRSIQATHKCTSLVHPGAVQKQTKASSTSPLPASLSGQSKSRQKHPRHLRHQGSCKQETNRIGLQKGS